jgi:hypothetical protein
VAAQFPCNAICFDVEDDDNAIVLGWMLEGRGEKGRSWNVLAQMQADRRGG